MDATRSIDRQVCIRFSTEKLMSAFHPLWPLKNSGENRMEAPRDYYNIVMHGHGANPDGGVGTAI